MNELSLQECADSILDIMCVQNYSSSTIKYYKSVYQRFIDYCHSINLETFDEMTAIEYVNKITGKELTDLVKRYEETEKYKVLLRALRLLGDYARTGIFSSRFSKYHAPVEEHLYWNDIYNKFMNYLRYDCDYSEQTLRHKELTIRLMMNILIQQNVNSLQEVDSHVMEMIVSQFIHEAPKSITHRIGEMKQFFQYCFNNVNAQ